MPKHVVQQLTHELDQKLSLPLSRASILLLGVAYKKNVNDIRESPAFKIIELLSDRVADLAFHDPYVSDLHMTRNHPELAGMKSIEINADSVSAYDAVVVVTDHDGVDYELINRHARLIIDTRNAFGNRRVGVEPEIEDAGGDAELHHHRLPQVAGGEMVALAQDRVRQKIR